jgi:putative acetyltransferase
LPAQPVIVREEAPADFSSVEALLERAFGRPDEASLVRRVRDADPRVISLVAVTDDRIVGHILFTPVAMEAHQTLLMGLGPMAVEPAQQRQGIGTALAREGLEACRAAGTGLIFVLGHAEYYPRFGFQPAAASGFHYKSEEFDPHFMVLELVPGSTGARGGMVSYLPEFDQV